MVVLYLQLSVVVRHRVSRTLATASMPDPTWGRDRPACEVTDQWGRVADARSQLAV